MCIVYYKMRKNVIFVSENIKWNYVYATHTNEDCSWQPFEKIWNNDKSWLI